jgi:hypothetical protein
VIPGGKRISIQPEIIFRKKIGRTVFVLPVVRGFARHEDKNSSKLARRGFLRRIRRKIWKL